MEKLFLFVLISLVHTIHSENETDGQYYELKKYFIAKNVLDKLQFDITVRKCPSPFSCWPGRCLMIEKQQICICPRGFTSESGRCITKQTHSRNKKLCQNVNCYPGECCVKNGWNTCLCPERYYSEEGMCKRNELTCRIIDCRPGKCIRESTVERCLCPEGFTATTNKCMEIAYTSANKVSTIMLMIIVAIASVMLTTFFGVSICYCYYRRQNIEY